MGTLFPLLQVAGVGEQHLGQKKLRFLVHLVDRTNLSIALGFLDALEAAGIQFIEQNGGRPGVRLKRVP